jgi:hypothetical protein
MAQSTDHSGNTRKTICVGDVMWFTLQERMGIEVTITSVDTDVIGFTYPGGLADFVPTANAGELLSPV